MAELDPIRELRLQLEAESLESRFQRLLVTIFRRISDNGYFPAQDLLREIENHGAVKFATQWLQEDRSEPALELLIRVNRVEFAIEWLTWRIPYRDLFTDEDRALAEQHFRAVSGTPQALYSVRREGTPRESTLTGLPEVTVLGPPWTTHSTPKWSETPGNAITIASQALTHLKKDLSYSPYDLSCLRRRRVSDFDALETEQRLQLLEEELRQGYPFSCTSDIFDYCLEGAEGAADRFQRTLSHVNAAHHELAGRIEPAIRILRVALDLSEAKRIEAHKRLRCSKERAARFLAIRAALACSDIGTFLTAFEQRYLAGAPSRPFLLSERLTAYLGSEEARLANLAVAVSHLLPCEGVALHCEGIISFGDLPSEDLKGLPSVREATEQDLEKLVDYDIDNEFSDVDIEAVILFAHSQLDLSDGVEGTDLSTSSATDPRTQVEISLQEKILLLAMRVGGPDRVEAAERAMSSRMGTLFDKLCAPARANLIGAEYTLLDEWHPAPSLAIVAICVAFEHQLKTAFLQPLADFTLDRGHRCFPKDENKMIVREGRFLEKPLQQISRALRESDSVWLEFQQTTGFDLKKMKRTIDAVKDVRDPVAHKGGLDRANVEQYRDSWLHPERGIFAVLFPVGSSE